MNHSNVKIDRIVILDDVKFLRFVAKLEQDAMERSIPDRLKLEERRSDEPYVVLKKGDSSFASSTFTTDIQAIDLEKLLNQLCEYKLTTNMKLLQDDEEHKKKLLKIFLLSHDLFCSSVELLIELIKRFFVPFPSNATKNEKTLYNTLIRTPTQLVVLDVIASWIELRYKDLHENKYLSKLLEIFVRYASGNEALLPVDENVKRCLRLFLFMKTHCFNIADLAEKAASKLKASPLETQAKGIMIYNIKSEMDIEVATNYLKRYSPKQLAHQMTRIDLQILKSIRIRNLPHNNKNTEDFLQDDIHTYGFKHTNYLAFMMVYTIISQFKRKKKAKLITNLLETAFNLLALNNFQSFSCVMGALMNTATKIHPKIPRDSSSQNIKRRLEYEELFSNTTAFRNRISKAQLPKIPCIMIINEDLSKLVGMQNPYLELDARKLMNFKLMEESASVIDSLISTQTSVYDSLEHDSELESFLLDYPIRMMKKLDTGMNISQLQTKLMKIAQRNLRFSAV